MNDLSLLHAARKRPLHRHAQPVTHTLEADGTITSVYACGHPWSAENAKRGKNNRKRGNRAELAVAREYGGEKVGPLGLKEDVRGKIYKTQVKTHVGLPPAWFVKAPTIRLIQPSTQLYVWICSDVLGSGWLAYAPDRWYALIQNMDGDGRIPRLIERWKPGQGVRPIDWIIVRRQDEPSETLFTGHYVAWSGFDWLDRYGKDE